MNRSQFRSRDPTVPQHDAGNFDPKNNKVNYRRKQEMKKLLTILVLALALCLVCGAAMADSVEITGQAYINATQKAKASISWPTASPFTLDHDLDAGTPDVTFTMTTSLYGMKCLDIKTVRFEGKDDKGVTVWFEFVYQKPHNDPDPANHAIGHTTSKWPQCKVDGEKFYVCSHCNEKIYEVIPQLGHTWERNPAYWYDAIYDKSGKAPTCGEPGYYVRACLDCGAVQPGTQQDIAEIAHEFVFVWKVAPTCKTKGIADYVCSYCGKDWLSYYNEGGYTATAWRHYNVYLPICGPTVSWTPSDAAAEPRLADIASQYGDTKNKNYKGHDFDEWVVDTPASCFTETVFARWCKVCGQKQLMTNTERFGWSDQWAPEYVLAETERDDCWSVWATFTCKNCNGLYHPNYYLYLEDMMTAKATNPWMYAEDWAKIDMLPDVVQKIEAHEYVKKDKYKIGTIKPTCEGEGGTAYACTYEIDIMGMKIGAGKDIEIKNNEVIGNTHPYKLFNGKPALGHKWVGGGEGWVMYKAPKAETNEYGVWTRTCDVCGKTENRVSPYYPDACEVHTYKVESEIPATCTTDGEKVEVCSRCGDTIVTVLPAGHKLPAAPTAVKKAATCSEEGVDLYICSVCSTAVEKTTAKLPHAWGAWVVTKEATKEAKGEETRTCANCGATEKRDVDYVITTPATYTLTVAYDGTTVNGKLEHVEDTLEAPVKNIRVTFYVEGNYYMATMAEVAEDGSFSVDGVGPIVYITVAATGNSSVNPEDYQKIAEPQEIYVK